MATRGTIPVQSEPYTKGYYAFWALLSVVAIFYIGFLAFGSDQASIIKISKVEETSGLVIKFREQSKRVSTALSIASQAKQQTTINSKRLNSIEKRVQLITWKLAGNEQAVKVSQQIPADDQTLAYQAIKQVIGGDDNNDGGIIGSVIQAPSKALNTARAAAGKAAATAKAKAKAATMAAAKLATATTKISSASDTISSIAGVVDSKPLSGSNFFNSPAQDLDTLNPLKVAALSAGIAKKASAAAKIIAPVAAVASAAGAAASLQKVSLKTPAAEAKKALLVQKSPFTTMPLPVRKAYGVRLTAGRSVAALRLTWDLINEMNRPILKGLSTRFVEGPSQVGMPYRLIAGPVPTAPQAQALCAKLHKQNLNCDVTVFKGRRL